NVLPLIPPTFQRSGDIIENLSPQTAASVAFFPNFSLKRLEGRRFAILLRQPAHVGDDGLHLCIWIARLKRRRSKAPEHVRAVFFAKLLKTRLDTCRSKVAFQKPAGLRERVREQDLVDKVDGRCSALNIQEKT